MEHHSIGNFFYIIVLFFLAQFITEGVSVSFKYVNNSINYLPEKHQ